MTQQTSIFVTSKRSVNAVLNLAKRGRRWIIAAACTAAAAFPLQAHAAPKVVTSIKPIHSIVSSVMEGVGSPDLIITGNASPHNYSLRPSQARALSQADLVIWVGPTLETFLKKPVSTLSTNVIQLMETAGIERRPFQEAETTGNGDDHDHGHEHGDDHGHDHAGALDPHIWLSFDNGIAIAKAAAAQLSKIDPENSEAYQANAKTFENRMKIAKLRVKSSLIANKPTNYIVFHNAYGYFEHDHKLRPSGVVTLNPEIAPGAKRLTELRALLREKAIACVFSEPQFNASIADALVAGTQIKVRVLDPLGANLENGPDLYPTLVKNVAKSFTDCAAASS